jgi:hypothetical protein
MAAAESLQCSRSWEFSQYEGGKLLVHGCNPRRLPLERHCFRSTVLQLGSAGDSSSPRSFDGKSLGQMPGRPMGGRRSR